VSLTFLDFPLKIGSVLSLYGFSAGNWECLSFYGVSNGLALLVFPMEIGNVLSLFDCFASNMEMGLSFWVVLPRMRECP
jgi:hypothetical protein